MYHLWLTVKCIVVNESLPTTISGDGLIIDEQLDEDDDDEC